MAKKRADARNIHITKEIMAARNMRRRNRCENNPALFCRTYFPKTFYNAFTADQKQTIADLEQAIRYGGLLAVAAPRGDGKSSIGKVVAGVWALVYGHLNWLAIVEANSTEANGTLADIKSYYERPVGDDMFGQDFPEVCMPVRALEGNAQRQKAQTVTCWPDTEPRRTFIEWGQDGIVLPTIHGWEGSGAQITPRGAEKPIRGLAKQDKRPEFVLLNDIETEDSARSLLQITTRKANIERGIMGLAGPGQSIGILMLCTVLNGQCIAAQYTDRKLNPIWNGRRYRYIVKWPDHQDMWDRYLALQAKAGDNGQRGAATAFYKKNRAEMDKGAIVSNKHRFDGGKGPDGKPLELSALQHAYNLIAKMGKEQFDCEYQNEPPTDESAAIQLTPDCISEKLNMLERGFEPGEKTVGFIDVHDEKLFWAIVSWRAGLTGYVIDYGVNKIYVPIVGSVTKDDRRKQVDIAIKDALIEFKAECPYSLNLGLVDAGYKSEVVYSWCSSYADGIWQPCRGYSSGLGGRFPKPSKSRKGIRNVGVGYYQSSVYDAKTWLWLLDADRYKRLVQNGFKATDCDVPGSVSLFGNDPVIHRAFAEQIINEVWLPSDMKFVASSGKGRPTNNHWLDCVAGCCAGAEILGIRLMQAGQAVKVGKKVRLSEVQAARRNR